MSKSPHETAEILFGAIPHAITSDLLEEYGLEAAHVRVQEITMELLALSLFRIHWALQAAFPSTERDQVVAALHLRIISGWKNDLALDGSDPVEFFALAADRLQTYTQALQKGAGAVDIANETAVLLVSNSAVQPGDRQKALGLIIDLVPDTELVDMMEEIRSGG